MYGTFLFNSILKMEERIIIIATLQLIENKLSELQKTVKELQTHCLKTENGMLQYDWYLSDDGSTIKVLETYVNSAVVLFHFDNLKSFAPKLSKSRSFISLEVYGNANEELKERVKKINAKHYAMISSLNKLQG